MAEICSYCRRRIEVGDRVRMVLRENVLKNWARQDRYKRNYRFRVFGREDRTLLACENCCKLMDETSLEWEVDHAK